MQPREFAIDQRIVKSNLRRIRTGIRKINSRQPSPVDRSQAHGARLAGTIDLAAFQIESAEFLAGFANGEHFRVGGGIVRGSHLIRAFANDGAVFHDYRTERSAASRVDVINRELNGAGHERVVHVVLLSVYFALIESRILA